MSKSASETGVNAFGVSGMIVAALLSWSAWHSIGWAFLATMSGWFYVIYYWLKYM